jgi:hypothetical protein
MDRKTLKVLLTSQDSQRFNVGTMCHEVYVQAISSSCHTRDSMSTSMVSMEVAIRCRNSGRSCGRGGCSSHTPTEKNHRG